MPGNQCSCALKLVPLFNVKLESNIATQRVGKTCSPNYVKGSSHAIKGLKENTLNETQSGACVLAHTETRTTNAELFIAHEANKKSPTVCRGRTRPSSKSVDRQPRACFVRSTFCRTKQKDNDETSTTKQQTANKLPTY